MHLCALHDTFGNLLQMLMKRLRSYHLHLYIIAYLFMIDAELYFDVSKTSVIPRAVLPPPVCDLALLSKTSWSYKSFKT